jgi:hypothetical protein
MLITSTAARVVMLCTTHADKMPVLQGNATCAVAVTRLVEAAHHVPCLLHHLARHAALLAHAVS